MISTLACPLCRALVPPEGIGFDRLGRASLTCPSCHSRLEAEIRLRPVATDAPARQPGLDTETRLAALGDPHPSTRPTSGRRLRRLGGLLACAVLVLALIGQHAWFRSEAWLRDARLRPWIEAVCARIDCRLPLPRQPDYLRIVERHIGRHPTVSDALRIELTFENTAPFTLPAPWLDVTFFDSLRRPVAGRRFRPEDYLPPELAPDTPLEPGRTLRVRLDIVDPGPKALGFEFAFGYD